MKKFSQWLNEMATLNFGGAKGFPGKDHTQVPDHYLKWMKTKLDDEGADFNMSDRGRRISPDEQKALISQELQKRSGGRPTGYSTPNASPINPVTPVRNNNSLGNYWVWAKSLIAAPEFGIPAANLDLAVRQKDANNWNYTIIDPEDRRLVSFGTIPNDQIRNLIKSQRDNQNQLVKADKPSSLLNIINPKKLSGKRTIPDEYITDEQKAVDEKFQQMMTSEQDHMIISALAGSGKTTVLKHLAWKYSSGKKWLYLVFNTKNKEEAKEEFPPNVQVETTNSWAGRELLAKNNLKPTDRIQDYSTFSEKVRLIVDSKNFKLELTSIGIPQQEHLFGNDPSGLSRSDKSLWYILRSINSEFKQEVIKITGLSKSFAVDPRSDAELKSKIEEVMSKYDLNTELEDIKEKIEKNNPWAKKSLAEIFGYDFMSHSFKQEMIEAVNWLLIELMPHNSQETFTSDSPRKKGEVINLGLTRDFDDDLWFAAIHANELKWPKYDVVLADEVQDFNMAQQIILKKLAEAGAKIVAVGDKNQSIYRFRGADSDAFDNLKNTLSSISGNKDVERTLNSNFRSRQSVIDFANEEGEMNNHVNNLVKGRNFKEGPGKLGKGIATKYEQKYDDVFSNLKDEFDHMGEIKQTAFLSRTNEPLVHASLKLMKMGIPFIILGKDIANDLTKHIDKIADLFFMRSESSVSELLANINSYHSDQREKNDGKSSMHGKLKELKETTEAMESSITTFLEEHHEGTLFEFRKWLRDKFGGIELDKSGKQGELQRRDFKKKLEELNPVILTTVHKSKGLQFQRVYILRDDLWPHPRASRQEDKLQELNNKYIAMTRAEDELHILDLKGQPGVPEK